MPSERTTTDSGAWRPQPGDSITGKLERVSQHDAGYGPYPILELVTDGGTVAVHAFHDVLKSELASRAPKLGDEITITYDGKHAEKGYHRYRVGGGDGSVDWSKFGGATSPADDSIPF